MSQHLEGIEDRLTSIAAKSVKLKASLADARGMMIAPEVTKGWRDELRSLEQEAAALELRRASVIEANDMQRKAAELARTDAADARASEEATFWFRRFFTSLAIANGAAFVALAAGFLQADDRALVAPLLPSPMTHFGVGMVLAGAVPLLFWLKIQTGKIPEKWMIGHISNGSVTGLIVSFVSASVIALLMGLYICVAAIEDFGNSSITPSSPTPRVEDPPEPSPRPAAPSAAPSPSRESDRASVNPSR